MTKSTVALRVEQGDALDFRCDVLVLKYAQEPYGVDRNAQARLALAGRPARLPATGDSSISDGTGAMASGHVLFVGVERLEHFGYAQMRAFARRALELLARDAAAARHVAMTLHGAGYGLDEAESFRALLAGIMEAIAAGAMPRNLETISFVERTPSRAARMAQLLQQLLPACQVDSRAAPDPFDALPGESRAALASAGQAAAAAKPTVFVAMPFASDMDDLFHYGIQGAIHGAGMLAERADLASFTGDVMDWVRLRIERARLVVADLSTANPNVFLEVGYAWGRKVPTVLVVRDTETLKFDVRGQRCLVYGSIKDLEDKLGRELVALNAAG
jgi:hypothetical protein